MVEKIEATESIDLFINALKKDGVVIVKNFATYEDLDKSLEEVQPYLDADKPWEGKLFPPETKRCFRLISRSKIVREKFFENSIYQNCSEYFLNRTTTNYYDENKTIYTTYPLLSMSMTMAIGPGGKAQRIHRDDKNHHAKHIKSNEYIMGNDILVGLMIPTCKTTIENAATQIIPGSHLWGDERPPFRDELIHAELEKGEAIILLGSLYHCGATNYSKTIRPMHIMFQCPGIYRQEEIPWLAYSIDQVKKYSPLVQQRLGYKSSAPNLGWIDLKSPDFLLKEEEEQIQGDDIVGHKDLDDA
ncbi:hypothetical protein C6P40_003959 [Pichia californica]|uniref:Phytanoyl-CoA dioxygenase n=1 Tax=Pichia californica TaxID=460514 RepID=A0A9P6WI49_9ASCO|nr:hypothetical protein C6P42_003297 [[Candida] californica]KAG0686488.1 hypothetical protein C6P40_003959 [[Candida] californica]